MSFNDNNNITEFRGEYRFLSNFHIHPIVYKGILYPSSEHAYVSMKSNDPRIKIQISQERSPGKVKKLGRGVDIASDWLDIRLNVMEEILRIKFSDTELKNRLLSTGNRLIYEGNWWKDTFWGVDIETGFGQNNLGKLLMKIRDEMKYNSIL